MIPAMKLNLRAFCLVVFSLFLMLAAPAGVQAQASAQGSEERLILQNTRTGKEKRIPKGARINVHGPKGTAPIKGRFNSVQGDSLSVTKLDKKTVVKVPVDQVSGVRRIVLAVILLGGYYLASSLVSVASGIFGFALSGIPVILAIGFTIGLSIPTVFLALFLIWLGARKYMKPKWRIALTEKLDAGTQINDK